jgi:hypothetical protein
MLNICSPKNWHHFIFGSFMLWHRLFSGGLDLYYFIWVIKDFIRESPILNPQIKDWSRFNNGGDTGKWVYIIPSFTVYGIIEDLDLSVEEYE